MMDIKALIRESITNKDIIKCPTSYSKNTYDEIFVKSILVGKLLGKSEYYCAKLMSKYIEKCNGDATTVNENRFKYKNNMYVKLRYVCTLVYKLYSAENRQLMVKQVETLLGNIINVINANDVKIKEIDINKDVNFYKVYYKKPKKALLSTLKDSTVDNSEVAVSNKSDSIINSSNILQKDEIKRILMNNINKSMDEIKKAIEEEISKRLDKAFSA